MILKFKKCMNIIYRWCHLFSEMLFNYSIGLLMKEVLMILNLWIKIK